MGKTQYNAYHLVAAFLFGAAAGVGVCGLLTDVLQRRTIDARVVRALEAENRHRQTRAKDAGRGGDSEERPVRPVGNSASETDYTTAKDTPGEGGTEASESCDLQGADDSGAIAPSENDWPPLDRDKSGPYIISADEFAEPEYFKVSLTWFQGDSPPVMVDEHNDPIRNYELLTGSIGYRTFGGPSQDENIAYIRNEKRQTDFEIIRSYGSYAQEILNYGRPG